MTVRSKLRVGLRYRAQDVLTLPRLFCVLSVASHLFLDNARIDLNLMAFCSFNMNIDHLATVLPIQLLDTSGLDHHSRMDWNLVEI